MGRFRESAKPDIARKQRNEKEKDKRQPGELLKLSEEGKEHVGQRNHHGRAGGEQGKL